MNLNLSNLPALGLWLALLGAVVLFGGRLAANTARRVPV